MMITAATGAACAADGWRVGDHGLTTLLPRNIDDNGPNSFIAFHINRRNAYSLEVPNGNIAKGAAYDAVEITSAGSFGPFSGKISKFSMKPASLALDTSFITVSGQITNWAGQTGCTISFDAAYVLRH
jgi:hypothetical protein